MKTLSRILLAAIAVFAISCDDILEEDITDDMVTIISPLADQEIESNVVNFRWNEIDGADDYRIQVFSSSGQAVVLDSLVGGSNFTYAITPGSYQWRVRGENFAYETAYSFPVNFSVIATEDLTNQQVILNSPADGFYTSNTALSLSWTNVPNADSYMLELVNVTDGNTVVIPESSVNGTSYSLDNATISEDAQYRWRVKALNSTNATETQYSARNFYIDRAAPPQSQNSTPQNEAVLPPNQEMTFQWTAPADTGAVTSSLSYTIEIASDTGFTNIIETGVNLTNNSYPYTFTTAGNYYWRVRAKDRAGNMSGYSTYTKLIIQ